MRIELNPDNSKKLQAGEAKALAELGLTTSPNEMVNMVIGAIDQIELQEIIALTLRLKSSDGKTQTKKIVKRRMYVLDLK